MQKIFNKIRKNSSQFPTSEYRQYSKLKTFSLVIFVVLLVAMISGVFYIFKNVYYAIEQIESIVVLKSELGLEVINFELFEKVKGEWEKKQAETILPSRDPFNANIPTSTVRDENTRKQ